MSRFVYGGVLGACLLAGWIALRPWTSVHAQLDSQAGDRDAACAPCHEDIYERYRRTPMANASGPAALGFIPANFVHAASGVHYQVTEEDGRVWLSFARDGGAGRALKGQRELRYFIGSGRRG